MDIASAGGGQFQRVRMARFFLSIRKKHPVACEREDKHRLFDGLRPYLTEGRIPVEASYEPGFSRLAEACS